MVFGLFVHAATLNAIKWLDFIPFISEQFRMSTFFAVSAILSTLVLQRRPAGIFIRQRLIMLLIPFAAGVVLLNPLTLWLIWQVHGPKPERFLTIMSLSFSNDGVGKPDNLVWHLHLWFLFSLAIYAIFTPALNQIIGSMKVRHALDSLFERIPAPLRIISFALCAAAIALLLRVVGEVLFPQLYDWWLTRATLLNLTFFITGLFISHSIWLGNLGFDKLSVLISVFIIIILKLGIFDSGSDIGKLVELCLSQVVNVSAIFFFMWVFKKIASRPSRVVDFVIRTIYTIYIFHYLYIYIVGVLFVGSGVSKYLVYLIAIITSFLMGIATHTIVSKVPLLSWLFNGKPAPQRQCSPI